MVLWNGVAVGFRRAIGGVPGVLDEAAGWLRGREIRQWPGCFEAEWVAPAIARGETWVATVAGEVCGTVTLDWADPLWGDVAGEAGYVHRMAVRRRVAGLGTVILDWVAGEARREGAAFLRLDCVGSNWGLWAYYEARGCEHRGDVDVRGAPGQRGGGGPATRVSRYELPLASAGEGEGGPGVGAEVAEGADG
ncbi:GNAT family N-acetyltransferase [Nocardiopsis protaetiae]